MAAVSEVKTVMAMIANMTAPRAVQKRRRRKRSTTRDNERNPQVLVR
jgi:hypothetical protein